MISEDECAIIWRKKAMLWRKKCREANRACRVHSLVAQLAAQRSVDGWNEIVQLRTEVERLRSTLEAVEWDQGGMCPWCKRWRQQGHAPDCARQRALGL